jgi:hypothetical protein
MEKIRKQKSYRRSYGPVVIWLEDLAEIVAILNENCNDVQISTEDYRFKTVDELKDHVGSQAQFALEIDGHSPYVSADFDRTSATFHVSAGTQAAYVFHEIDSIIARRQRHFPLIYNWWLLMLSSIATLGLSYFWILTGQTGPARHVLSVVQIITFLWFLWAAFVNVRRTSVVKLQRRSEARPFFERNKDQLLMLLIGAIVGGLMTFAGVVVKEKFYPSAPAVSLPKSP